MSVVEEVSDEVDVGKKITDVVVRFAGDSGDGMQLTGSNFTEATALYVMISRPSQTFPLKSALRQEQLLGFRLFRSILVQKTLPLPVMMLMCSWP